jgi:hypothetical protein
MSTNRQYGIRQCWIFGAIAVCVALVDSGRVQAQETYTSSPGKTSISANYDPNAPAPKAPVGSAEPIYQKPFLSAVPMEQYLAKQAEIAKYSQASFSSPPAIEVMSGAGPLPRAPEAKAPLAAAPTSSWEGLTYTSLNPPSPDIAVGPSDVLMVVNSTIGQFTKAGVLKKSTTFQTWFANVLPATCPSTCLLFDPWIAYDQMHGHFLFLATAKPANIQAGSATYLLLSVSNGPTYDGGWKTWALNISMDGAVATANFGDFWHLGFDNIAVYLSGNMYSASSGAFQYAKVRVLKKTDLYNPALTTLPFQEIGSASKPLKNADGTFADSLIPIHMRGQPGARAAAFFVNAANISVLPATYLTVWKITDPLAATLAMTATNIGGLMSYMMPAPAPQLASSVPINPNDTTVLKAIYRNGFLYTARNSGYRDATTSITYDVINLSTLQASTQARVVNANVFYPSFDVPATVPLGAQSVTDTPISGTTTASDGSLTFAGLSKNLKAGESPFFSTSACPTSPPSPCRWGDYFGGAIDPLTGGLWVSGEYAKTPLTGGSGVWGTWVAQYPWSTTQLFTDVPPSSVFFDYINVLNTWQITTGCSVTPAKFCPNDLVTREQLTTLIIRSMLGDVFTYQQTPYFTDVTAASPFFSYIQKAMELGITHGCTATAFCPQGSVSRMDASVLLVRGKLESLSGDNFSFPSTPFFTDVPANLAQFPYIQKLYELGLTTGCTPTQFCPNNNLTRQEISVFLTRAFLN